MLFNVSQILAHSLDLRRTLCGVLEELETRAALARGIVTLLNPETGELILEAMIGQGGTTFEPVDVRYRSGEGIIGQIVETGETIIVNRIADEPRFIGRLGIYDSNLPFIAVPIRLGPRIVGVLAAQPIESAGVDLKDRCGRSRWSRILSGR